MLIPPNTTVIEPGAGTGLLTEVLAKKARRVVAIEIDENVKHYLYRLKQRQRNVEILINNVLSLDLKSIILKESKYKSPIVIVSNLPYHITEPFIVKTAPLGKRMILTVGKKFGFQATVTNPKESVFTEISLVVRSYFKVKKLFNIPKSAFTPQPSTDSVVLEFTPKKSPYNLNDFLFRKLIEGQTHGSLVKNALTEAYLGYKKLTGDLLTKNQGRAFVANLKLPENILNKGFSQLTNEDVRILVQRVDDSN